MLLRVADLKPCMAAYTTRVTERHSPHERSVPSDPATVFHRAQIIAGVVHCSINEYSRPFVIQSRWGLLKSEAQQRGWPASVQQRGAMGGKYHACHIQLHNASATWVLIDAIYFAQRFCSHLYSCMIRFGSQLAQLKLARACHTHKNRKRVAPELHDSSLPRRDAQLTVQSLGRSDQQQVSCAPAYNRNQNHPYLPISIFFLMSFCPW